MHDGALLLPARMVKTFKKEIMVNFPEEDTISFLVHESTIATLECYYDEQNKTKEEHEARARMLWNVPNHCSLTCEFWQIARIPHTNLHGNASNHDFAAVKALVERVVKFPNATLKQQRELKEIYGQTSNLGEDLTRQVLILEDDEFMSRTTHLEEQSDEYFNKVFWRVAFPCAFGLLILSICSLLLLYFKKKVCTFF